MDVSSKQKKHRNKIEEWQVLDEVSGPYMYASLSAFGLALMRNLAHACTRTNQALDELSYAIWPFASAQQECQCG